MHHDHEIDALTMSEYSTIASAAEACVAARTAMLAALEVQGAGTVDRAEALRHEQDVVAARSACVFYKRLLAALAKGGA